jgi:hypothetical protein
MATIAKVMSGIAPSNARLTASSVERVLSGLVLAAVVAAILYGWLHRHDDWINPEHGFGYALGIVGGSMMLLLLGYPLRKRVRSKAMGSVGFWFRFHMLLGLAGPLAILFHSRFTFGSLNSAMALGAMIVVASSGLIGRFFYSRVHRGYSGRKLELRELKLEMDAIFEEMEKEGSLPAQALKDLQPLEQKAIEAGHNFWSSALAVVDLSWRTRSTHRKLLRELSWPDTAGDTGVRSRFAEFFEALRRAAEFAFYDRLLRLWHLLHLPLFIMLVAAALVHILAVHMY